MKKHIILLVTFITLVMRCNTENTSPSMQSMPIRENANDRLSSEHTDINSYESASAIELQRK